jgi:hypothetical protein
MARATTGKARTKKGKAGTKKAPGRPSSFREEFVGQTVKLCRLGATEKEIADFFGVDIATIGRWKHRHPKFRVSLKEGREQADANVADRLYSRALGYTHKAVKILQDKGIPIVVPYEHHYPPDTVACIFWLKNRRPDLWRDRVGLEHTGPGGGPIQTEGEFRMTPEDEAVIARIRETRESLQKGGEET